MKLGEQEREYGKHINSIILIVAFGCWDRYTFVLLFLPLRRVRAECSGLGIRAYVRAVSRVRFTTTLLPSLPSPKQHGFEKANSEGGRAEGSKNATCRTQPQAHARTPIHIHTRHTCHRAGVVPLDIGQGCEGARGGLPCRPHAWVWFGRLLGTLAPVTFMSQMFPPGRARSAAVGSFYFFIFISLLLLSLPAAAKRQSADRE